MNGRYSKCWLGMLIALCSFLLLAETSASDGGQETKGKAKELPLFLSATADFRDLERPPVLFYHDKHTAALKEEGCKVCHPENQSKEIKGTYLYTFPKDKPREGKKALMDAFHQGCIGCHTERSKEGKKAGALTCGECHVQRELTGTEYQAKGPEFYQILEDPYHKACIACHKNDTEVKDEAKPLDWKEFFIQVKEREQTQWPPVVLDYYRHYQHEKALEKKCDLCHHLYSEKEKKLIYKEGTESSCRDCHREKDVEKKRSYRNVAHGQCIACHMEREKAGQKAGPNTCTGCHTKEKERTLKELADIPRPNVKQKEQYLISIDKAALKEVPLDHKAHEGYTRTCRSCHHETQKACKECHPLKGIKEGGFINLAQAYHEVSSEWSCIGCHDAKKKAEKSCAGCHYLLPSGLTESSCNPCHAGPTEAPGAGPMLRAPDQLLPDKLDEELSISVLEDQYKASKFPHLKIIRKLTELTKEDKLAKYFHTQEMTLCMGCHHDSPMEAKKPLPSCNTCHTALNEPRKEVPALFGAFHRQCLGCHEKMGLKVKPRDCSKCHEPKPEAEAKAGNK